jgi:hypothetical protein
MCCDFSQLPMSQISVVLAWGGNHENAEVYVCDVPHQWEIVLDYGIFMKNVVTKALLNS